MDNMMVNSNFLEAKLQERERIDQSSFFILSTLVITYVLPENLVLKKIGAQIIWHPKRW